jgi:hypothetical protein
VPKAGSPKGVGIRDDFLARFRGHGQPPAPFKSLDTEIRLVRRVASVGNSRERWPAQGFKNSNLVDFRPHVIDVAGNHG